MEVSVHIYATVCYFTFVLGLWISEDVTSGKETLENTAVETAAILIFVILFGIVKITIIPDFILLNILLLITYLVGKIAGALLKFYSNVIGKKIVKL